MGNMFGYFVNMAEDGSTSTSKVKTYQTYEEMIADNDDIKYAIVGDSGTVYHKNNDQWVVGFANTTFKDDYTAFEVMPNKVDIAVGDIDDVTGLEYSVAIPACTIHKMQIRSAQPANICDVIVDWGDGTIEVINDGKHTFTGSSYELAHDYDPKMTSDKQRFIVKIYGRDYWAVRHQSYLGYNLMSRVFDIDLPVSSHIANFASMCFGAYRLLSVNFKNYYHRIENLASLFCKCKNLVSAKGFGTILNNTNGEAGGLFEQCDSLIETDFRYPAGVTSIGSTFALCKKLAMDINDLLPVYGFESKTIEITVPFSNCRALTGEGFGDKLWNDNTINWIVKPTGTTTKTYPFTGSSLIALVPESWGGTLTE